MVAAGRLFLLTDLKNIINRFYHKQHEIISKFKKKKKLYNLREPVKIQV